MLHGCRPARTDMEDAKKLLSEGEAKAAKAEVDEVEKALAKLRDEREALFAKLRELDEKVSAQGVKMREAQVKYAAYAGHSASTTTPKRG